MVYENNDDFQFPSLIPDDISNPVSASVARWTGHLEISLEVWDVDPDGGDDEIYTGKKTISQKAASSVSSAVWTDYSMGTDTTFQFSVRVYCESEYQGPDCGMWCHDTDNQNSFFEIKQKRDMEEL
ncbi:uncharacterized protein LOC119736172 [Patiria miniata]|uniref:Uncharacterized protein n=1 Tax=Patiria miniata TaxID=46514 RepID=A0A914AQT1_PATMI|nr:uncharacterized protein LOC119736172 [Patiria miniata]